MIPGSPEQLLEERIDRLVSEMDELMIASRECPSLIERQSIGIGQIAGTRIGAAFFVPIACVLERFKVDLIV